MDLPPPRKCVVYEWGGIRSHVEIDSVDLFLPNSGGLLDLLIGGGLITVGGDSTASRRSRMALLIGRRL